MSQKGAKKNAGQGGTIWNARRVRFAHKQRKNYFYFAFVALCGALQTHFHGRGWERTPSVKAYGFDS
ncbi:hypothetical protein, partial [Faecalibacterium tardum]|uniref:hypothetical protein n=1 Tax=Faecalibacterium tardum TaxID=3133156 RepID=UPI0032C1AB2D